MGYTKSTNPVVALIMIGVTAGVLAAAANATAGAPRERPESYMPARLDGVPVKTCVVDVKGNSTCSPDTLGEAALDAGRLGISMLVVSGLKGSDDKRWDHVVYGVTNTPCASGGASMGAMRTHPGVFRDRKKELEGMITSGKLPLAKAKLDGLDVYVGYLQGKDCIMAFGYPNDTTVLVAFAGKDDTAKVEKVVKSMLGSAKNSGPARK